MPTLEDIFEQLLRPGRDPRADLPAPILRSDVLSLDDLTPGLRLQGTVRNVVDFGAFVDIGVKQDGLLHRSQMPPGTVAAGRRYRGGGDPERRGRAGTHRAGLGECEIAIHYPNRSAGSINAAYRFDRGAQLLRHGDLLGTPAARLAFSSELKLV